MRSFTTPSNKTDLFFLLAEQYLAVFLQEVETYRKIIDTFHTLASESINRPHPEHFHRDIPFL